MQWSTERAGDFLITAWLEECEVGGCAKACSVQVGYLDAPGSLLLLDTPHMGSAGIGQRRPPRADYQCSAVGHITHVWALLEMSLSFEVPATRCVQGHAAVIP